MIFQFVQESGKNYTLSTNSFLRCGTQSIKYCGTQSIEY